MDLNFTSEEIAFRDEVRSFLASEIPDAIKRKQFSGHELTKDDIVTVQRILNARGWAVPHWPVEWGGQDWTPVQHYIFNDELERASVPTPLPFNTALVGPVIAAFGSDALKQRFLAATANLDIWWCQGFSEPEAGSDLAAVKTTARREGDYYIVNGQKTWTTQAHFADWMFCLVRTNTGAKKQEGISFLLFDMRSPGVTVDPSSSSMEAMRSTRFSSTTSASLPTSSSARRTRAGPMRIPAWTGRHEHCPRGFTKAQVERIKTIAKRTPSKFGTMLDDPIFRRRVTELEVELKALEMTQLRVVTAEGKTKVQCRRSHHVGFEDRRLGPATDRNRTSSRSAWACDFERIRTAEFSIRRTGYRQHLLQLAQGLHLWRVQRDPAQHHLQGDPWLLKAQFHELNSPRSSLLQEQPRAHDR